MNNPATGEVIANVACMGGRETNDAIASAYDAFNCMSLQAELCYDFIVEICLSQLALFFMN